MAGLGLGETHGGDPGVAVGAVEAGAVASARRLAQTETQISTHSLQIIALPETVEISVSTLWETLPQKSHHQTGSFLVRIYAASCVGAGTAGVRNMSGGIKSGRSAANSGQMIHQSFGRRSET